MDSPRPSNATIWKLTKTHYVLIFVGIFTVVGTPIGLLLLNEWNKPDVRYEEEASYPTGDQLVHSLRLYNYGQSDAKEITITAQFAKPVLKQPSTSDAAMPFTITAYNGPRKLDHQLSYTGGPRKGR